SAMMRSRPVKFICRAAVRARSRGRAVKSAMEKARVPFAFCGAPAQASESMPGAPEFVAGLPGFLPFPGVVFGMGMVTARDSGRRRRPLQTGQRVADMYCIMYSRYPSDLVSSRLE